MEKPPGAGERPEVDDSFRKRIVELEKRVDELEAVNAAAARGFQAHEAQLFALTCAVVTLLGVSEEARSACARGVGIELIRQLTQSPDAHPEGRRQLQQMLAAADFASRQGPSQPPSA